MRFRLVVVVLVAAVLVPLASAIGAEEEVEFDALKCRNAVDKLCSDTEPASEARRSCLREKAKDLPPECRGKKMRTHGALGAGSEGLRKACGTEIDTHCDEVRRGGGRMLRCLRGLDAKSVSKGCGAYLETLAAMRAKGAKPGADASGKAE